MNSSYLVVCTTPSKHWVEHARMSWPFMALPVGLVLSQFAGAAKNKGKGMRALLCTQAQLCQVGRRPGLEASPQKSRESSGTAFHPGPQLVHQLDTRGSIRLWAPAERELKTRKTLGKIYKTELVFQKDKMEKLLD